MNRHLLKWEIGGFFFIGLMGAALHFTFEFSNFENMVVAFFSAVNESTWEHLKMIFWPGVLFMLVEYTYVKDEVTNYLIAKVAGLIVMPLIIVVGWYGYTSFTGRYIFPIDLTLFYVATGVGQVVSYKILTRPPLAPRFRLSAIAMFGVLLIAFSTFTFFPPRIFLFEHYDLRDSGEYGILESYEGLRYFTQPPETTSED